MMTAAYSRSSPKRKVDDRFSPQEQWRQRWRDQRDLLNVCHRDIRRAYATFDAFLANVLAMHEAGDDEAAWSAIRDRLGVMGRA